MGGVIEVSLESGDSLLVEADGGAAVATRGGAASDNLAQAERSFEDSLQRIRPVVDALLHEMRHAGDASGEITAEFGFKSNIEAGMVVARTGAEANVQIVLSWPCGGPSRDLGETGSARS